jgi:serine/threonine protein kinase
VRNYLVSNETKLGITENISPIDVWKQKFPQANELALDLLSKLLCFNAKKRITVREAIQHDYFKEIIMLETPPVAQVKFNWDWEYKNTKLLSSIPFVKKLIYMES